MNRVPYRALKLRMASWFWFCEQGQKTEPDIAMFSKLDIRVGRILECWKHPESEHLYCQKIQVRDEPEVIRSIGSGLQKYVPLERMTGNVLVLSNLKMRRLAGFCSEGMILCATSQDSEECWPLFVEGRVGERVYLPGHQQLFVGNQLLKTVSPKRKILQKCLPFLKTDRQGYACWKYLRLMHSGGYIQANLKDAIIS